MSMKVPFAFLFVQCALSRIGSEGNVCWLFSHAKISLAVSLKSSGNALRYNGARGTEDILMHGCNFELSYYAC